eukprot:gnl/TRDRNA2_/TRDRNA2_119019_c2_seq1.p1 gnl/TRDRNA2_/TRDRNA2_119019_c2~~gnl/TRDRNA2_/TRDRNA2_119019_c2_seq1.p1  ORF type:complete len:280 (+),score=16.58 gnl/TRDRNA2_/TRDRNA2_119019_c2_seq1:100-840(+)
MIASEFLMFADLELQMDVLHSNGNFWVLRRRGGEPDRSNFAFSIWDAFLAERIHYPLDMPSQQQRCRKCMAHVELNEAGGRPLWECKLPGEIDVREATNFKNMSRRLVLLRFGSPLGNSYNRLIGWPTVVADARQDSRVGYYEFVPADSSDPDSKVRFALPHDPSTFGDASDYQVLLLPEWADPYFPYLHTDLYRAHDRPFHFHVTKKLLLGNRTSLAATRALRLLSFDQLLALGGTCVAGSCWAE